MIATLEKLEEITGRGCYDHVSESFSGMEIPVISGIQAQGDLLAVPVDHDPEGTTPIPTQGVDVIPAANGGHAHTVVGNGTIHVRNPQSPDDLVLAQVSCKEPVYLFHQEHGATGLAAGNWEIRGQREFDAAEARRIAD